MSSKCFKVLESLCKWCEGKAPRAASSAVRDFSPSDLFREIWCVIPGGRENKKSCLVNKNYCRVKQKKDLQPKSPLRRSIVWLRWMREKDLICGHTSEIHAGERERDAIRAQHWREPDYKSGETSKPTQEDKYLSAMFGVEDEAARSQQSRTRSAHLRAVWWRLIRRVWDLSLIGGALGLKFSQTKWDSQELTTNWKLVTSLKTAVAHSESRSLHIFHVFFFCVCVSTAALLSELQHCTDRTDADVISPEFRWMFFRQLWRKDNNYAHPAPLAARWFLFVHKQDACWLHLGVSSAETERGFLKRWKEIQGLMMSLTFQSVAYLTLKMLSYNT